jgi:hypothetical protein
MFLPALAAVGGQSQVASARSTVAGVDQVLNGLAPGISVRLDYAGVLGGAEVVLSGHQVSVQTPQASLVAYCRWTLPGYVLSPGHSYVLSLDGSSVKVTEVG